MNEMKLENYNLTASVHTFAVRSENEPIIPFGINKNVIREPKYTKRNGWLTVINLNTQYGDIFSYSEFKRLSEKLFADMEIKDCTFWRTDIRLDSYEDNFMKYYKLNSLLVNLLNLLFNHSHKQAIEISLSQTKQQTNAKGKNQYYEVTYYDKKLQTNDTDPAKARLEFRILKPTNEWGYTLGEIKSIWFKKLDAIVPMYDKLQEECNKNLLQAYRKYCSYSKEPEKENLTKFFSEYTNGLTVYTKEQLCNFFLLCGVSKTKVKDRIKYICNNYKIEFFTEEELIKYIEKIKKVLNNFFDY